jgi:hypothetical protein
VFARNKHSLAVVRGLIGRGIEQTYGFYDRRCAPEDLLGSVVAGNVRQLLWADIQRHQGDPEATLIAPSRRGNKLDYLILHDRLQIPLRVRKHPREERSDVVLQPTGAQVDLFGEVEQATLYVTFDVDLRTQGLAEVWLSEIAGFDTRTPRVLDWLPLPPPPAQLLPDTIPPWPDDEPKGTGFDEWEFDRPGDNPGDEPA